MKSGLQLAYNSTLSSTREATDAVEYAFRGNRFTWYGRLGAAMGKADVQVDGKMDAIVDCYDADEIPNVALYTRTFPSAGDHKIKIAVRPDRNARSSDNWVAIDGFQVGKKELTVVDDVPEQGIAYAGSGWMHSSSGWERASGGSVSWTSAPSDSAEYKFQGGAITWVGKRCPACGLADVYIDGTLDTTVDTYMPDEDQFRVYLQGGWQAPLYEKSWPEPGPHTLRIIVRQDKNMLSAGHSVYLDSLQIGKE